MFVAAGVMLWGGWMLLPRHIGTYFVNEDFARVHEHFHFWIWTYRIHLFGMVTTAIALVALAYRCRCSRTRYASRA
jgi:TRAP-type C4-dicarboxylate transport system permease small subunit